MKISGFLIIILFALSVHAQNFSREIPLAENASIQITNLHGRVNVIAETDEKTDDAEAKTKAKKLSLTAQNGKESDLKISTEKNRLEILVQSPNANRRIDLTLKIPARMKLKIETADGEIRIEGDFQLAELKSETGTIAANVPLDDLNYNFVWTESRPRFVSDIELKEIKEKAAGKFVLNGVIFDGESSKHKKSKTENEPTKSDDSEESNGAEQSVADEPKTENRKSKKQKSENIKLNFTTARGIILLNVNPNEVPSDLRERPLTEAAKAIIRSGDSLLMEAIRRASPKFFGDYAKTLPPRKALPTLNENPVVNNQVNSQIKRVLVRVTDLNNRAVGNLKKEDFEISESSEPREILSVEPTTAPFNLILLLDVSGSVDNYVDFIRKSARNFVNTVSASDKVAIIIFNEDVKTLSTFTTDKGKLSESLDTFDAGGGTAYYDALAFTLAETLRPLKGDRTAIVVLSDGDDTRSFLSFDALLGSIQESGALIYPLYVPSGLIAAAANEDPNSPIDPLRSRYMSLTTKAESEGEKLAQISGGVYYPIAQTRDLQKAYDDIVSQLRAAYSIIFRSDTAEIRDNRAAPRLKIKVKRENSFVKLGSVVEVK